MSKCLRCFFFFLLSLFFSQIIFAQTSSSTTKEIQAYKSEYSSDDVLAFFGQKRSYSYPTPYQASWGIDAELKTNIECGKIQFSENIKQTIDQIAKIPDRVMTLVGQTFNDVLAAAPMLALCSVDPTLCAELKNVDLKVNADIGLQTNACHAINQFIDDKSQKGKLEAYNKALQKCVQEKSGGNSVDLLDAITDCQKNISSDNVLVSDIINRKMNTVLSKPQEVLKSVFQSVGNYLTDGDKDRYELLNAVLGETKILANGSVLPVLPPTNKVVSPKDVTQYLLAKGNDVSCNSSQMIQILDDAQTSDNADASSRYLDNAVYGVIHTNLTKDDVYNMDVLSKGDKDLVCSYLGRSIAKKSMDVVIADIKNSMDQVIKNDYVPEDIRKNYSVKSAGFTSSLGSSMDLESTFPVDVVRSQIANMSNTMRRKNSALGASLSDAYMKNEKQNSLPSCDSAITCQ